MDRKAFKQAQQDKVDMMINGRDLADTMAQLEIDMMELAQKIDKCKSKKTKAKLNQRLEKLTQIALTVSAGNVSLLNH